MSPVNDSSKETILEVHHAHCHSAGMSVTNFSCCQHTYTCTDQSMSCS